MLGAAPDRNAAPVAPTIAAAGALLVATLLGAGCGRSVPGSAPDVGVLSDSRLVADRDRRPDRGPGLDAARPDASGPILPARVMVFLSQVRDHASGAEQGSARVLATPDPHPYFASLFTVSPICAVYPSSVLSVQQLDVGSVSFSGGPQSFKLEPDRPLKRGDFLYPGILFPRMFTDRSTVRISATGGQLPGFASSVGGVRRLTVSFPKSPLSRAGSLALTLSGGDAGRAELTIVGVTSSNAITTTIRCRFGYTASGAQVIDFGSRVLGALPSITDAISLLVGRVNETAIEPRPLVRVHLFTAYYTSTRLSLTR